VAIANARLLGLAVSGQRAVGSSMVAALMACRRQAACLLPVTSYQLFVTAEGLSKFNQRLWALGMSFGVHTDLITSMAILEGFVCQPSFGHTQAAPRRDLLLPLDSLRRRSSQAKIADLPRLVHSNWQKRHLGLASATPTTWLRDEITWPRDEITAGSQPPL
jgi:hypothetical protein